MSKYIVTLATEEDIEDVLDMVRLFHKESPYCCIPWCSDSASAYLFSVLDDGLLAIAKDQDGYPVGVIGFECGPLPFNSLHYVYLEKFYYVKGYARESNVGVLLIRFAEKEIKRRDDAGHIVMATLSTSPAHVGQFYAQRGYRYVESGYMKEVV